MERCDWARWSALRRATPEAILWLDLEMRGDALWLGALLHQEHAYVFNAAEWQQQRYAIWRIVDEALVLGGHHLRDFDLPHLVRLLGADAATLQRWQDKTIDTLYFSSLLLPQRAHHALDKEALRPSNQPDFDAAASRDRWQQCLQLWHDLEPCWQALFAHLLPLPEVLPRGKNKAWQDWGLSEALQQYLESITHPDWQYWGLAAFLFAAHQGSALRPPRWLLQQAAGASWWLGEALFYRLPSADDWRDCDAGYEASEALRNWASAVLQGQKAYLLSDAPPHHSLLPALYLSAQRRQFTVVICAHKHSIKQQLQALPTVRIAGFHTDTTLHEQASITQALIAGEIDILLITPERLRQKRFRHLLRQCAPRLWLIQDAEALDEAWRFRPDWWRVMEQIAPEALIAWQGRQHPPRLWAAWSQSQWQLFDERTAAPRLPQVRYVRRELRAASILKSLQEALPPRAVIYLRKRRQVEHWARQWQQAGLRVAAYHAQLKPSVKEALERDWQSGSIPYLIATPAWQDTANSWVIHAAPPPSLNALKREIAGATSAYLYWDEADFEALWQQERRQRIPNNKTLHECWRDLRPRLQAQGHCSFSPQDWALLLDQHTPELLHRQCRIALLALERYGLLRETEALPAQFQLYLEPKAPPEALFQKLQTGQWHTLDVLQWARWCGIQAQEVPHNLQAWQAAGYLQWRWHSQWRWSGQAEALLNVLQRMLNEAHIQPLQARLLLQESASILGWQLEQEQGRWQAYHHDLARPWADFWQAGCDLWRRLLHFARAWQQRYPLRGEAYPLPPHCPPETITLLQQLQALHIVQWAAWQEYTPLLCVSAGDKKRYHENAYQELRQHYAESCRRLHFMQLFCRSEEALQAQLYREHEDWDSETCLRAHLEDVERCSQPYALEEQAFVLPHDFSEAQRQIVCDSSRALMILAGPGAGKTAVVVHRIAYLLMTQGIRADKILVLAYNRAAVASLKIRLYSLLGRHAQAVCIETFHGLARRITQKNEHDAPPAHPDPYAWLLQEALRLLPQSALSFQYIMVDEFQDIDALQYRLIDALAGLERNEEQWEQRAHLMVVGDDDQNLYAFRGASVAFLQRFAQHYQLAAQKQYRLLCNYRSNADVVDLSQLYLERALAVTERLKAGQRLYAARPSQPQALAYGFFEHDYDAAAFIAQELKRLLQQEKQRVAILCRSWRECDVIQDALERAGLEALRRDVHLDAAPLDSVIGRLLKQHLLTLGQTVIRPLAYLEQWRQAQGYHHHDAAWAALCASVADLEALPAASCLLYLESASLHPQCNISLSTYHGVKGLEFDSVYIINRQARETPEEVRALYVALTRARHRLTVLFQRRHHSRLLAQCFQERLEALPIAVQPPPERLSFHRYLTWSEIYLSPPAWVSEPGRQAVLDYALYGVSGAEQKLRYARAFLERYRHADLKIKGFTSAWLYQKQLHYYQRAAYTGEAHEHAIILPYLHIQL